MEARVTHLVRIYSPRLCRDNEPFGYLIVVAEELLVIEQLAILSPNSIQVHAHLCLHKRTPTKGIPTAPLLSGVLLANLKIPLPSVPGLELS